VPTVLCYEENAKQLYTRGGWLALSMYSTVAQERRLSNHNCCIIYDSWGRELCSTWVDVAHLGNFMFDFTCFVFCFTSQSHVYLGVYLCGAMDFFCAASHHHWKEEAQGHPVLHWGVWATRGCSLLWELTFLLSLLPSFIHSSS